MKHRTPTDSVTHQFRLLRNRVEAEVTAPAVILVTSATGRDGASATARGLAESLSKTHQRTALITASTGDANVQVAGTPGTQRRRASDALAGPVSPPAHGLSVVSISHERLATISRTHVAGMVTSLLAEHDYVIVDGGDLPNDGFPMLFIASADAALVTFLTGRPQVPDDRVMLEQLERAELKLLGVVMTDQESIDHGVERDARPESDGAALPFPASLPLPQPVVQRLAVALQRNGKSS